jgi:hypothetical protein
LIWSSTLDRQTASVGGCPARLTAAVRHIDELIVADAYALPDNAIAYQRRARGWDDDFTWPMWACDHDRGSAYYDCRKDNRQLLHLTLQRANMGRDFCDRKSQVRPRL